MNHERGEEDMKKEELMKLEGMTEALAEEVVKIADDEIKGLIPKARFDEVNEAKKNAENLVKERDKQLELLKGSTGDAEALKKQITELQESNKKAVEAKDAEIAKLKFDNAVITAIKEAGAKNEKAVISLLDLAGIEISEYGIVKGLDKQIKALKESDAYLFKDSNQASTPKGMTPKANDVDPVQNGVTKEQFNKMGYKQRAELNEKNPQLYQSLVSETK